MIIPAVVAVAGHVTGITVFDVLGPFIVAEVVPDVGAFAVLVPRAFALVGSAGYAPEKTIREMCHGKSFDLALVNRNFFVLYRSGMIRVHQLFCAFRRAGI